MSDVILLVDAEVNEPGTLLASTPSTIAWISALKTAITDEPSTPEQQVHLLSVNSKIDWAELSQKPDLCICPLTLDLPEQLDFPEKGIYQACQDIAGLRQQAEQLGFPSAEGHLWLPIVLTSRGPLYGEVITVDSSSPPRLPLGELSTLNYRQPLHLRDAYRQPLYRLGHRLLFSLQAPPATYLLQFSFQGTRVFFDRLWPFPAFPAIASLGVQSPNLFTCHWHCLTDRPVLDLLIPADVLYAIHPDRLIDSSSTAS